MFHMIWPSRRYNRSKGPVEPESAQFDHHLKEEYREEQNVKEQQPGLRVVGCSRRVEGKADTRGDDAD